MKKLSAPAQELLDVIIRQLIPWATSGSGLVLLEGPPKVIGNNHVTERPGKVLSKNTQRYGGSVLSWHWYKENLNSMAIPYFGCVVEGEADIVVGTTAAMCRKLKIPGKKWIIQMPKGCFFLLPPGVPMSAGMGPHWQRPHPEKAYSHIFWAHVHDNGCECHFSTSREGKLWKHPHLFIPNEHLFPLSQNMLSEMINTPPDYVAFTYLHLSLLLRYMARTLKQGLTQIPQKGDAIPGGHAPPINAQLQLQRALDYIDQNLATAHLSTESIALHVRLSVSQLNRLFHQHYQQPIMRFVWNRRLEYGREMLLHSSHNIMQIGYRCGFAHTSSFIDAFIRKYGTSPARYRQQNLKVNDKPNE